MTLVELLVALAVLGLMSGLIFSNMGAWLGQSRASMREAAFWRSTTPAQLALSELAAGAIDPTQRRISTSDAHFRTLAPRLSTTPVDAVLRFESSNGETRLRFAGGGLESTILTSPDPLRFKPNSGDALVLEMRQAGVWRPIASADFITNAPPSCAFDLVSRACR